MIARVWLAGGMALIAATSGCHHRSRADAVAPPVSGDSLAGVVSVTGTSFEQHLVLRTDEGARGLAAAREDSSALMRLGGAEVVVYGTGHGDSFAVTAFIVKAIGGATVADGVLVRDRSRFSFRTRSGTLALGNPPAAFDSLAGARLWISGPLDTGPYVYGIIAPPER